MQYMGGLPKIGWLLKILLKMLDLILVGNSMDLEGT